MNCFTVAETESPLTWLEGTGADSLSLTGLNTLRLSNCRPMPSSIQWQGWPTERRVRRSRPRVAAFSWTPRWSRIWPARAPEMSGQRRQTLLAIGKTRIADRYRRLVAGWWARSGMEISSIRRQELSWWQSRSTAISRLSTLLEAFNANLPDWIVPSFVDLHHTFRNEALVPWELCPKCSWSKWKPLSQSWLEFCLGSRNLKPSNPERSELCWDETRPCFLVRVCQNSGCTLEKQPK